MFALFNNVLQVFWMTLLSTTFICAGYIILAIHIKYDLTKFGIYLILAFVILVILFVISIACASDHAITIKIAFSIISAFLFLTFLMCTTQLLLGGKHKFIYGPDEHVMAIFYLYCNILIITGNINEIFLL